MSQTKEQYKTPEKQINKMEAKQSTRYKIQNSVYKNAQ